jgi:hypothetical protein
LTAPTHPAAEHVSDKHKKCTSDAKVHSDPNLPKPLKRRRVPDPAKAIDSHQVNKFASSGANGARTDAHPIVKWLSPFPNGRQDRGSTVKPVLQSTDRAPRTEQASDPVPGQRPPPQSVKTAVCQAHTKDRQPGQSIGSSICEPSSRSGTSAQTGRDIKTQRKAAASIQSRIVSDDRVNEPVSGNSHKVEPLSAALLARKSRAASQAGLSSPDAPAPKVRWKSESACKPETKMSQLHDNVRRVNGASEHVEGSEGRRSVSSGKLLKRIKPQKGAQGQCIESVQLSEAPNVCLNSFPRDRYAEYGIPSSQAVKGSSVQSEVLCANDITECGSGLRLNKGAVRTCVWQAPGQNKYTASHFDYSRC